MERFTYHSLVGITVGSERDIGHEISRELGLYSSLTQRVLSRKSLFFEGVGGRFRWRLSDFLAFC